MKGQSTQVQSFRCDACVVAVVAVAAMKVPCRNLPGYIYSSAQILLQGMLRVLVSQAGTPVAGPFPHQLALFLQDKDMKKFFENRNLTHLKLLGLHAVSRFHVVRALADNVAVRKS